MTKILRPKTVWIVLLIAALAAGFYGIRRWMQLGVAADVQQYTPPDVDALLWLPRVDRATEDLVQFSRGVTETDGLRTFLKPETGVDIADPEGLRKAGIDPEAGLVLFTRKGNLFLLFGVEDAEKFTDALVAKFQNSGHSGVAPSQEGGALYRVPDPKDDALTVAAFGARDGLMALVYRRAGKDPLQVIDEVLEPLGEGSFFETQRYSEIVTKVGKDGPLIYADGHTFALTADGKPRSQWMKRVQMPAIVRSVITERVNRYLNNVSYLAARVDMNNCTAAVRSVVKVENDTALIPPNWLVSSQLPPPKFGELLPRDTVLMFRTAIRMERLSEIALQLGRMGSGIGGVFGLGKPSNDPVERFLGEHVHRDLADRHVVKDLTGHMTGHVAIGIVGLDTRVTIRKLTQIHRDPMAALQALNLVLLVEMHHPKKFIDTWWPKKTLLERFGYTVTRTNQGDSVVVQIQRGCKSGKSSCEEYGFLTAGNVVFFTSGRDTATRLQDVLALKASNLNTRTREPLAKNVLEEKNMLTGVYLSFDGLLKAVQKRNVPGGLKRYLSQFFEVAMSVDLNNDGVNGQLLLTR